MWEKANQVNQPGMALKDSGPVSVIGRAVKIRGRVQSRQDLYVDGEIDGILEAPESRLTIGPNGRAAAGASAREIEVLGTVDGDVVSTERVSIRKGGRVIGDVRAAGIVIEDGAFFKGSIDIIRKSAQSEAPGEQPPQTSTVEPGSVREQPKVLTAAARHES